VGLVGEILVKFHLEANNHAVRVIEEEGREAELPTLIQFFHNAMASASRNAHSLGMVDMIEHGCPNIICAQPFGCLPNRIIGEGMFCALRNRYPQANVVSVDYDPGASQVNQLNRIKLMISTAMEQHRRESADGVLDFGTVDIVWDEEDKGFEPRRPACGSCAMASLAAQSEFAVDRGDRPSLPIVAVTSN